jgi:two-component sensor histidine kinase
MFFDHVSHCVVHTRNGRLVFITPGLLQKDTSHTEPFIDKITINNREFVYDINARTTTLNAEEKNIAIDFSGINFSPVHNTRFTYQLAGLDTSWQVADESWSAQYANLAPGNYTFSIKTSSENAEWSRVFSLFAFTIKPIFWQTTWFRLVVTGGIALLIFLIVRRRVRIIRKEAGLKHKLAETEMMALRSQMNPHFIFNSLNAIDSLIQTNQPDKATTYLARFARLIRTVLESTKNSMVPFYKDFETLELFLQLEQFRSNNKFSYELQADKELSEGDYKVPPLIIQPFVENAIHHGLLNKQAGERNLVVKVSLQGNFIKYTIRDNGVGRTTANQIKVLNKPEHQSYGIQITTDRIHLHNGAQQTNNDVVITDIMENGQPGGTEVNVTLKV